MIKYRALFLLAKKPGKRVSKPKIVVIRLENRGHIKIRSGFLVSGPMLSILGRKVHHFWAFLDVAYTNARRAREGTCCVSQAFG